MKFSYAITNMLKLSAIAAIMPKARSQRVIDTADGINEVNVYDTSMSYMAGAYIEDDTLYIVDEPDSGYDSRVLAVPIERAADTGKITGFDFANSVTAWQAVETDDDTTACNVRLNCEASGLLFINKQPGSGQIFMGFEEDHLRYIDDYADVGLNSVIEYSSYKDYGEFQLPNGDWERIKSIYGFGFSPVITDPITGLEKLIIGSDYNFWEVDLELNTTTGEFDILYLNIADDDDVIDNSGATYFAKAVDTEDPTYAVHYPGAINFIPSGPLKGDMLFNGDARVNRITIDPTTGRPANMIDPETTMFVTISTDSWTSFFDPKTNDFFVGSYTDASESYIAHFDGLPPGVDTGVVLANINTELVEALVTLGARRKLSTEETAPNKVHRATKSKASKKGNTITSASVAAELTSSTPTEAAAYFEGLLTDTLNSPEYQDLVLSGGDSSAFLGTVAIFKGAIDDVETLGVNLAGQALTDFTANINEIKRLLAILEGIGIAAP